MKAAGSYAGASGNVEASRADYQESRKSTVTSGGMVILVLLVIAGIAYFFWKEVTGAFGNLGTALPDLSGKLPDSTVAAANAATATPEAAVNQYGTYYPVKTLTREDYDRMLSSLGLIEPVVRVGNVVTPQTVLDAAATAGSQSANTVNKLGLNDAYCNLDLVSKSFVTLGEGVGKLVGVDVIQAGYDMRGFVTNSRAQAPVSASQNLADNFFTGTDV
jgi:hypothetical protein